MPHPSSRETLTLEAPDNRGCKCCHEAPEPKQNPIPAVKGFLSFFRETYDVVYVRWPSRSVKPFGCKEGGVFCLLLLILMCPYAIDYSKGSFLFALIPENGSAERSFFGLYCRTFLRTPSSDLSTLAKSSNEQVTLVVAIFTIRGVDT